MAKILNIDAPMRECFLYRNVLIYLFYSLMSIIALYPIFIVSVPNLEDYPNHLARMYIISHYHSSPDLQHFYEVKWMMFPYIGMDATFILLTKILPIYDAGRVFIGLCVIMPALSVAVLYYSVHRRLSSSSNCRIPFQLQLVAAFRVPRLFIVSLLGDHRFRRLDLNDEMAALAAAACFLWSYAHFVSRSFGGVRRLLSNGSVF